MFSNKQTKWKLTVLLMAVALFSWPVAATAQEVNDVNLVGDPNLFGEPQMPGTIEGTGTYFEVNDSNYLDITLESSEPVHLMLESIPQMVVIDIEAAEGASSTQITLTGFEPETTYYKYEDDYHNEVTFTTDDNGSYTYTQNLTERHLVFIQPRASTIFLRASGWSDPTVGTWDATTQTGTLITDVYETIQIDSDGITLDGNGKNATGSGTGVGVSLYRRSGVTIKNLNIQRFTYGIRFNGSTGNMITGNTVSNNDHYGIYLYDYSSNNTLTENTTSNNYHGIYLYKSSNNTLTNNIASNNDHIGIHINSSTNNSLSGNAMSGNLHNFRIGFHAYLHSDSDFDHTIDISNTVDGKPVYYIRNINGVEYGSSTNAGVFYAINCDGITIKDLNLTTNAHGVFLWKTQNSRIENIIASNNEQGIYLQYSSGNILTGNTVSNSVWATGIYLGYDSNYNTLTHNTVSSNRWGIYVEKSTGNTLTGNTVDGSNFGNWGIGFVDSNDNTLTANTSSNSAWGIMIYRSSYITLTDNIASHNRRFGLYLNDSTGITLSGNRMSGNGYNFGIESEFLPLYSHFNHTMDTSNLVDGKPIYYLKDASGEVIDGSTNAGVVYAINCDNITITDLTLTKNYYGVFLWKTQNSIIENVSACDNYIDGLYLYDSSKNTLTGNTASNNYIGINLMYYSNENTLTCNTSSYNDRGIALYNNSNNTLIGNKVSNNDRFGIYLTSSSNTLTGNTITSNSLRGLYVGGSDNLIYNNNFIDNRMQAYVGYSGNVFNLSELEGGGNYWSDWTTPDVDPEDGFVDFPYIISTYYGAQDNLPLVSQVPSICNQPPVAAAGSGQTVHPGTMVTLNGSGSSDPDENYPLTYSWQIINKPVESMTVLLDANTVSSTFMPDLMGDYTIELVVTDSLGAQSAPDSVLVSTYNTAPIADAGEDQALLYLYTTVQLGTDPGRQSYDEDGDPITYLWTITTKPESSVATLHNPTSATPTFEADVYGTYVISLVVTDNFGAASDADTVTVSFTNVKPVADAGGNQAAVAGDTVLLDGSGSYDINGDPLTYSWSLVSKPEGSDAEIADPTSVQTSFVADQAGTYVVSLIVNDGLLDSNADNVTIEVITIRDALVQTLLDLIDAINALDPSSLKNVNMMKNPLTNKINAVLNKIDRGFYDEALDKLQNDILQKTNGCADTGQPDKNDWIIVCEGGQNIIHPLVIQAIELLENLI